MIQNAFFDYVYIDDFLVILDHFINHQPKYNYYNIGSGKRIDLVTIAKMINKLNNYALKIRVLKKGFNLEYTCDNQRLREELPNMKFTNFDKAVRELYNWYCSHPEIIDKGLIKRDQYTKV
jgi:GDP-L-fucose synthase